MIRAAHRARVSLAHVRAAERPQLITLATRAIADELGRRRHSRGVEDGSKVTIERMDDAIDVAVHPDGKLADRAFGLGFIAGVIAFLAFAIPNMAPSVPVRGYVIMGVISMVAGVGAGWGLSILARVFEPMGAKERASLARDLAEVGRRAVR